ETRVRLGKGCASQATKGRRDVAGLKPGRTEELQHRGGTTAQHVPRDNGLATVDDACNLVRGAPAGPGGAGLVARQPQATKNIGHPVDVTRMRLWRRIELA